MDTYGYESFITFCPKSITEKWKRRTFWIKHSLWTLELYIAAPAILYLGQVFRYTCESWVTSAIFYLVSVKILKCLETSISNQGFVCLILPFLSDALMNLLFTVPWPCETVFLEDLSASLCHLKVEEKIRWDIWILLLLRKFPERLSGTGLSPVLLLNLPGNLRSIKRNDLPFPNNPLEHLILKHLKRLRLNWRVQILW